MSSYKVGEFIGGCLAIAVIIGIIAALVNGNVKIGGILIGFIILMIIINSWKAILWIIAGCIGINLYNKKKKDR